MAHPTPERAGEPPAARDGRRTHVVVIGGGFAGLNCARELADAAAERPVRVTLVDRHNYHTFQPLLYQVATAGLQPQDIGHNLRNLFGRRRFRRDAGPVRVRMGTVVGVDWEAKRVLFSDGHEMPYDLLVVAAGASTNDYGIPGVLEHGYPLKSLTEAVTLRNHVLKQFERAALHPDAIADGALTFVVAGGGPTGVELAGTMTELFTVLRRDHPDLPHDRVRVVLVEMVDAVLPPYQPSSQRYTAEALEARGVELRLDTTIERVEADRVVFADGEELLTDTLIWTAGVKANPLAGVLGVEQTKGGRIAVGADLRIQGRDDAFAVGDIAGALGPDGDPLPQLAPVAIQEGKHVAAQVARLVDGEPTRPFRYRDRGTMATIGRRDAVVELPIGLRFGGILAWLAWLFLHLLYLVGFRNRVAVLFSWIWNYLTYDESHRLIIEPRDPEEDEEVAHAREELQPTG